jgi:hypothetical protein
MPPLITWMEKFMPKTDIFFGVQFLCSSRMVDGVVVKMAAYRSDGL